MPIIKVPVVHRFGIVSYDEHQKLQRKLLRKYLKDSSPKIKKTQINPFELTEDFIERFNDAVKTGEEEEFIQLAKKILAGCKRRSGLSTLGCGKHVDIPTAWIEAMMLSHCKGEIHDEALDVLLISLDHAPISPDHVPVLFFIAESILYKLCYDAVQKPYLFLCEIKLCKAPMSTYKTAELNSGQKQFKIKPFLWHSLLVWVCVHNSCSEMDEVLKHVLFYKEQLHQKDWLESVLGLMVLGETAKLNMSCLKVLMDLVRDFISSSMSLPKQQKSNPENLSCWHWQVGYIYTNILKEICLHGNSADLQKTAFLGFCDCIKEVKSDKGLRGAGLLELLSFHSSPDDDDHPDLFWVIRYGVIYNLVILRSELSGVVNRDGLRNAVWRALQKQKNIEKESRILDAVNVAEVEAKGLANLFLASKEKVLSSPREGSSSQYIGWRVATSMSHHFLPPIGPDIPLPRQPARKPPSMLHRESEPSVKEKKAKRLSLREELLRAGVPKYPYPDFFTRTDMELRRIVDNQWEKELELRLKLDEQILELELKEKQRQEEEHFRQIMKWRFEKLHKTTKPYELPFKREEEELTEASSTRLSGSQQSSQIWESAL
ncbi:transmembrane protein 232 isoform X6 [Hemicordylus capensis]|uniref:transmembrane protein 232 isoform X6 n=1 Tax=Hemicordylus capensis TaxID=884348 RepID=UPI002302FF9E|nr:transmembrane protein 232 isoform X6 [Hemicordylus capensis]